MSRIYTGIIVITLVFLQAFFVSCKGDKSNTIIKRSISFKTGNVDFNSFFIGTYFDKFENSDVVYFVDKKHCIKRFLLSGEILDSVPLAETIDFLADKLDEIRIVSIYAHDTILVLSNYSNTILTINGLGNIYNTKTIDNFVPDSLVDLVGIDNCFSANSNSDYNNLFYTLYPKQDYYSSHVFGYDTLGDFDKMLYANKFDFILPYFVNIRDFFSENSNSFLLVDDYASKFYNEGEFIFRFNDFKVIGDKLFVLPWELDIISVYSASNYAHLRDIKVDSKYTTVGYDPLTLQEYLQDDETHKLQGRIQYLFFNTNESRYYVIVSHNLKNERQFNETENGKYAPFSVIIYDENFENSKEYAFEENTYACRRAYMTTEGLLIQRKPENQDISNYGTQTFDLLNFN